MAAGGSSVWKTLLLPPFFALFLYILITYVLLPYYRRLRSYSTYNVLPSSPDTNAFAQGLFSRINDLLGRRRDSVSGVESLLGDEELEEGFEDISSNRIVRQDTIGRMAEDGRGNERRLSQELERGFRDSSDEEEDDRGRARR